MNDIHKAFTAQDKGFKYKILPSKEDVETLREVKLLVKKYLREEFNFFIICKSSMSMNINQLLTEC